MGHPLYKSLTFLDEEAILYRLDRGPPDGITVSVVLSDERFKVTLSDDGPTDFGRFNGDDNVGNASPAVARLHQMLIGDP